MRHRGIYVRVSPCHLQLAKESEKAEHVGINEVESDFKQQYKIRINYLFTVSSHMPVSPWAEWKLIFLTLR